MIESFRSRKLKGLYKDGGRSKIRADLVDKVERILTLLDAATSVQSLNLPGYNLHPLKGNLKEFWSVTVRSNWRIIFRFEAGNAYDVDLIDYH